MASKWYFTLGQARPRISLESVLIIRLSCKSSCSENGVSERKTRSRLSVGHARCGGGHHMGMSGEVHGSIHDPKREQAQPRIHPASTIVRFGSHNMNNNWSREGLTNSGYVGPPRRHRPLSCIAMGRAQRFWRVAELRNVWHDAWTCHSEITSCSTRNLAWRGEKANAARDCLIHNMRY